MEYREFIALTNYITLQDDLTIPTFTKDLRTFCDKHQFYLDGDTSEFYCSYDRWANTPAQVIKTLKNIIQRDYIEKGLT